MNDTGQARDDARGEERAVARHLPTLVLAVVLAASTFATGFVGCGFGTYEDTGGAEPGQWWPWVCPDGGDPTADGGCPPPPCSDAAAESCPQDGGTDGNP